MLLLNKLIHHKSSLYNILMFEFGELILDIQLQLGQWNVLIMVQVSIVSAESAVEVLCYGAEELDFGVLVVFAHVFFLLGWPQTEISL